MTNLDSILKSRDITFPTMVCLVKAYGFSCSHVWMWGLDCEEGWAPKNWCFWTVVLEKTFESSLDSRENQPVNPKWDQSWILTGWTDAEAETPIHWPTDLALFLGKDHDAGKDWRQEEKGTIEDDTVGRHPWLNGHGFGWTLGVGNGQGNLVCCSPWACKDRTCTD